MAAKPTTPDSHIGDRDVAAPRAGTVSPVSDSTARLNLTRDGDRIVVAGDVDAHTCPDLISELDPLPGTGDVRLDVAGVGFIDSSGLRAIIKAHQLAEASSRKLLIERPSKSVSRIFEISGLSEHLHIVDAG